MNLKILQIGKGRLGTSLEFYFNSKKKFISSYKILENQSEYLKFDDFSSYDWIFLAVQDQKLAPIISDLSAHQDKIVHFSGSLYFEGSLGIHPAYSFSGQEVDFAQLNLARDQESFPEALYDLFPGSFYLDPNKKAEYHAFISLFANSSQLMSYILGKDFENKTKLPSKFLKDIVIQSIESEKTKAAKSFSGPWTRGEFPQQEESVRQLQNQNLNFLLENFKNFMEVYKNEYS